MSGRCCNNCDYNYSMNHHDVASTISSHSQVPSLSSSCDTDELFSEGYEPPSSENNMYNAYPSNNGRTYVYQHQPQQQQLPQQCQRAPYRCNIHKTAKKIDLKQLEETYWAMWKPNKPSGSELIEKVLVPKVPLPDVNLGNYVQCKSCFKFIEREAKPPMAAAISPITDKVVYLHRNFTIDSDSTSDCNQPGITTITECDECESDYRQQGDTTEFNSCEEMPHDDNQPTITDSLTEPCPLHSNKCPLHDCTSYTYSMGEPNKSRGSSKATINQASKLCCHDFLTGEASSKHPSCYTSREKIDEQAKHHHSHTCREFLVGVMEVPSRPVLRKEAALSARRSVETMLNYNDEQVLGDNDDEEEPSSLPPAEGGVDPATMQNISEERLTSSSPASLYKYCAVRQSISSINNAFNKLFEEQVERKSDVVLVEDVNCDDVVVEPPTPRTEQFNENVVYKIVPELEQQTQCNFIEVEEQMQQQHQHEHDAPEIITLKTRQDPFEPASLDSIEGSAKAAPSINVKLSGVGRALLIKGHSYPLKQPANVKGRNSKPATSRAAAGARKLGKK